MNRDAVGEEGGINLYVFVGNDGINWIDILGEERITFEGLIRYEARAFEHWFYESDGECNLWEHFRNSNNCYSYACNDLRDHKDDPDGGRPEPGAACGYKMDNGFREYDPIKKTAVIGFSCEELSKAAVCDGLEKIECEAECPCGKYKVYSFLLIKKEKEIIGNLGEVSLNTGVDYHWVREDNGGTMSHKRGEFDVEQIQDTDSVKSGSTFKTGCLVSDWFCTEYKSCKNCFCVPDSGIEEKKTKKKQQ